MLQALKSWPKSVDSEVETMRQDQHGGALRDALEAHIGDNIKTSMDRKISSEKSVEGV